MMTTCILHNIEKVAIHYYLRIDIFQQYYLLLNVIELFLLTLQECNYDTILFQDIQQLYIYNNDSNINININIK